MFNKPKTAPLITAKSILDQYKKLGKTPSGERHAEEYYKLKSMVSENQDALYELVFSGQVTGNKELNELIFFGGHGGSVRKQDNISWIPFLRRVRERVNELPLAIQSEFEWLGSVHHYWD